jgi:hypothetical protein
MLMGMRMEGGASPPSRASRCCFTCNTDKEEFVVETRTRSW